MPDWIYRIGGTGTTLSQDEQDNNILCIYDALNRYGWSKVAIAGACGCFQQESSYNPGIYETSHGGTLNNLFSRRYGAGTMDRLSRIYGTISKPFAVVGREGKQKKLV